MTEDVRLDQYCAVAPRGVVDLARRLAEQLQGRSLLHVNSTRWGGGVAEMLHRLVPLFEQLGLAVRWEVIEGTPGFYQVTKSFHNALQGQPQEISAEMYAEFLRVNKSNGRKLNMDADFVVIHDPQPAPVDL